MKVLIIGATGFLGSAIARVLNARGHAVHGLSRNTENETKLKNAGVVPVQGDFENPTALCETAKAFDTIVFSAMIPFQREAEIVAALLEAHRGSGRHFLFTSGTGVLSIAAPNGEWNENTFTEDDPFPFLARTNREIRIKTEDMVRSAAKDGYHTTVVRPPLIFGNGGSVQIPRLFESAIKTGSACYLGQGLNLYSNVHVDDLAEVFALAIERGVPGALYHAVAGEANFRALAEAVAHVVGCDTKSLDLEAASALWGNFWVEVGLAVNSRSRAPRTRSELGWIPKHVDVVEDIRSGSYRDAYMAWKEGRGGLIKISSHG
ncbi:NAD-dependent epimerase/dehydratase family protein [Sphingobium subterraneum]|uniref:Nucleoside-diphosphate-sugar epimerase n=1 Tax=Sphingobium subterraneum TaxID=627688 RepID=A0A841J717_9SPHN|nr:NAD-dependent epimerase/dehydratase family protein [Sphingobium subterraneum]MBB6125326.1 nucleoside-diphosphate-sugar epimerase [Sphingobium subterraneum]